MVLIKTAEYIKEVLDPKPTIEIPFSGIEGIITQEDLSEEFLLNPLMIDGYRNNQLEPYFKNISTELNHAELLKNLNSSWFTSKDGKVCFKLGLFKFDVDHERFCTFGTRFNYDTTLSQRMDFQEKLDNYLNENYSYEDMVKFFYDSYIWRKEAIIKIITDYKNKASLYAIRLTQEIDAN